MVKKKMSLQDLGSTLPKTEESLEVKPEPQKAKVTIDEKGLWMKRIHINPFHTSICAAKVLAILEDRIIFETHFETNKEGRYSLYKSALENKGSTTYHFCSAQEGLKIRSFHKALIQKNQEMSADMSRFRDGKPGGFGFGDENTPTWEFGGFSGGRDSSNRDGFLSPNYD